MIIGKHMARRTATSPSRRATCTSAPARRATTSTATYRIFSYTFEMSIKDYPDDSLIASETGRNKEAVLYLMERAWCPLSVLGAAVRDRALRRLRRRPRGRPRLDGQPRRHRHGARDAAGSPAATRPATTGHGPKQLGDDAVRLEGVRDRRRRPAHRPNANDLDGRTTVRSPAIDAAGRRRPAADLPLRLRPRRDARPSADSLRAIVERADGVAGRGLHASRARRPTSTARGARRSISMDAFAGQTDPAPVRGRRRRPGQPRRGRARRHPGDRAGLTASSPASSRVP